MGMNQTPASERVHISFFGKRNAGKSSVINAITGQDLAIVSSVRGTTTDPVYKIMELLPLGPVMIIDTPGIDDEGELGALRVRKSYQVLNKTDIAILVVDSTTGKGEEELALLHRFHEKGIPYLVVYNKIDLLSGEEIKDLAMSVRPGEVLVIDSSGEHSYFLEGAGRKCASCIFEYVYFARPDSVLDGCSVYESRKEAGRLLAKYNPVDADIVSGVPDSAVVAARGYSEATGIPYVETLAKNRYVGRTFIQPDQSMRENSVSVKMNALRANVQGKRLILIDDSIVRGTTSKKIVKMLRDAGAKEVHMMICSPVIKHPCYLGIDMQSYSQLIGANKSVEEIAAYIGADSLRYLTVEQLKETVKSANVQFCTGCFDKNYPYPMDDYEADKHKFE